MVLVSAMSACISHCASIRPTCLYKPSIYNNQVYAPSIDEMVSSFPENRQYFCQYVKTQPHTINNIVNTTDIDNIIDCVRSAIDQLSHCITLYQIVIGGYRNDKPIVF